MKNLIEFLLGAALCIMGLWIACGIKQERVLRQKAHRIEGTPPLWWDAEYKANLKRFR